MKSVGDLGFLTDVKEVSPNTVTVGRVDEQDENWAENVDPEVAAREYIAQHIEQYRLNPGVDYWEGWNEFVPVTEARWRWYGAFEAARACQMQALGYRAAVGGFVAGAPEYHEMPWFLAGLEAAHRCDGIFTVHEGVSPVIGCGVFTNEANVIPGAPSFPGVTLGYMMLRYRFWYEGYLKPRGLGDLPLVISEVAMAGAVPHQWCNGEPASYTWRDYREWWVEQGFAPTGEAAFVKLMAWYDSELRKDPYVLGAAIFTAGGQGNRWSHMDVHEALIPLAEYVVAQD
jgi:hypothetical protein